MRVGEAEGDPEGDGRRTLANGWESRLWRLEDKHLREGSSVRQFGRPRPLKIRHRRRRMEIIEEEREMRERRGEGGAVLGDIKGRERKLEERRV